MLVCWNPFLHSSLAQATDTVLPINVSSRESGWDRQPNSPGWIGERDWDLGYVWTVAVAVTARLSEAAASEAFVLAGPTHVRRAAVRGQSKQSLRLWERGGGSHVWRAQQHMALFLPWCCACASMHMPAAHRVHMNGWQITGQWPSLRDGLPFAFPLFSPEERARFEHPTKPVL
jgi:hypothetical protein